MIEITEFSKSGGPLTKSICLDDDGRLISNGAACVMTHGEARRTPIRSLRDLDALFQKMKPTQAIALGRLKAELPHKVRVVPRAKLNGGASTIARTTEFLMYTPGELALMLADFDTKGMPAAVHAKLETLGGVAATLASIVPGFDRCGCLARRSTSTGLSRQDTGEEFVGSDGIHLYIVVRDGADNERALRTLHDRCWLNGLGWMEVGRAGQLLDRSIVDRMVYGAERLVFEGPPVLTPPLTQHLERRRARVHDGDPLDTATAIPSLTLTEQIALKNLKTEAARELKPDSIKARRSFVAVQSERLIKRGIAAAEAPAIIERMIDDGVILPDVALEFDDEDFAGCTVADILGDPERFIGATLADPLEGVAYGRCKAKILRSDDGSLWVHSFAHGRTIYNLKFDAARLRAALARIPDKDIIAAFVRLTRRMGEIDGVSRVRIGRELIARLKIGVREFNRLERDAIAAVDAEDARAVEPEADDRPVIRITKGELDRIADEAEDALISMGADVYQRGVLVSPHIIEMPAADGGRTHAPLLREITPHGMLDRFCRVARWLRPHRDNWVADNPPMPVAHILLERFQWRFPPVRGMLTTPTLRPDGSLLTTPGYDPQSAYILWLPPSLVVPAISDEPEKSECEAALRVLEALLDEFPFIDDGGASRSVGLSLMITAVVRAAMAVAPIHAATAPAAGTGKSYLFDVASAIATGDRCGVIFAGTDKDELEKKLNGLLLEGAPLFNLDNLELPLGGDLLAQAATQPRLDLRRMGSSDIIHALNCAVVGATGNNLVVHDDLTRRVLRAMLDRGVERPELHRFSGNPFRTVLADRGRYVAAILTVVRGYLADRSAVEPYSVVGFDDWTRFVRGPLVWLGRADPADSFTGLRAADPVINDLLGVMAAWEAAIGLGREITASEIVRRITEDPPPFRYGDDAEGWKTERQRWADLAAIVHSHSARRSPRANSRDIGEWLRRHRDRIVAWHDPDNRAVPVSRKFTGRSGMGGIIRWRLVEA